MGVIMSCKIKSVFCGLRSCCGFRPSHFGFVGVMKFLIIAAMPHNAVAQFPGVGSEAPSGVATTASYDGSSDTAYPDQSVSDAGHSDVGGNASNGATGVPTQSIYDGDSSGYRISDSGGSNLGFKREHRRKQLFIKKLRVEFAAIELVERKTGLPFSRSNVPSYLNELRSDLKTMVIGAENGMGIDVALRSIARDASFIEARLNDHLDQLLEQAGQPVPKKPLFAIKPSLSGVSLISDAEIDALSLKFELAEYGEKALQAMGTKRY